MNRSPSRLFILALIVVLGAACAATPGPGYKAADMEETYAVQTVEALMEALNTNSVSQIMSKVSSGYYRGYASLEKDLTDLMGRCEFFIEADIRKIEVTESKTTVAIEWKAVHLTKTPEGKEARRGRTDLIFQRGLGLKLLDYSGDPLPGF